MTIRSSLGPVCILFVDKKRKVRKKVAMDGRLSEGFTGVK